MQTTLTSKGQVTIPLKFRQHLGLQQGMAVNFTLAGDHIELRPAPSPRQGIASGFGLIKSRLQAVPADFDVAEGVVGMDLQTP